MLLEILCFIKLQMVFQKLHFSSCIKYCRCREWQRFVAPQALSDDISIAEDEVKEIELFGYDAFNTWVLMQILKLLSSDPSYGTLSNLQLADEGVISKMDATYTPTSNVNNVTDNITFTVINSNNTQGISNEATVSMSISPINDAPVIVPVLMLHLMRIFFICSSNIFRL